MKKIILLSVACFLTFSIHAQFNLLDKVQNKVNDKANQKVDQQIDKGVDDATSGNKNSGKKKDKPSKDSASATTSSNKTTTNNTIPSQESGSIKAYNNYDFVPGENILFEDHFTDTQDGEFPSHWDLLSGQGVVNKAAGKSAFLLTEGNYVKVKPVMKTENYLTDPFTAEFDFYAGRGTYNVQMFFKDSEGEGKYIAFGPEVKSGYFTHDLSATYPGNQEEFYNKWHHAAFIYKNGQMKCYIDQYRVLVIPKCNFVPEAIEFGGIGSQEGPLTFTNVKIAAGGAMNMLDKIMTDGKFVTHAITFDVNKSTIKPESMGFLNQMAKYMKDNSTLKLEVDGHTDSDGADDLNMKLSQSRAEAVKAQLVSMGIEDSRLSAKGFGKTKPISDNNSVEGKANNRRVEFVKM